MRLQVYSINGNATGKEINLDDKIFGIEPNDHAIYLAVKSYQAAQRQGTHKSKERSEISGSTKTTKSKTLARNSALAYKAKNEKLKCIENFSLDTPKTKTFVDILTKLGVNGERTLMVTADNEKNIYMSARNLPKADVVSLSGLNIYNIMNAKTVVFTESAISSLQ